MGDSQSDAAILVLDDGGATTEHGEPPPLPSMQRTPPPWHALVCCVLSHHARTLMTAAALARSTAGNAATPIPWLSLKGWRRVNLVLSSVLVLLVLSGIIAWLVIGAAPSPPPTHPSFKSEPRALTVRLAPAQLAHSILCDRIQKAQGRDNDDGHADNMDGVPAANVCGPDPLRPVLEHRPRDGPVLWLRGHFRVGPCRRRPSLHNVAIPRSYRGPASPRAPDR